MRMLVVSVSLLALIMTSVAGAADDSVVKADLVANVETIQRGKPFLLGIHMKIEHPWHVYWKNPGDSGLPTTVQLNLPEGFEMGELQYPLPKRFDQPGDILGYGYERELMIIAEVTPPGELTQGTSVNLAVEVEYLRCADVCIPGAARPSLTLAITDAPPKSANEELFKTWSGRMPLADIEGTPIAEMVIARTADPTGNGEQIDVLARWRDAVPPDVEWFPNPNSSIVVDSMKHETREKTSVLSMHVIGAPGGEPLALPMLITFGDGSGKRTGVETVVQPDE